MSISNTTPVLAVDEKNLIPVSDHLKQMADIPPSRMFLINKSLKVYVEKNAGAKIFDASQGDGGASLPGYTKTDFGTRASTPAGAWYGLRYAVRYRSLSQSRDRTILEVRLRPPVGDPPTYSPPRADAMPSSKPIKPCWHWDMDARATSSWSRAFRGFPTTGDRTAWARMFCGRPVTRRKVGHIPKMRFVKA